MNSPALGAHPHLDIDEQVYAAEQHRNRMHNEWCQQHNARTAMDHPSSRVKALLLVQEAARLELTHLAHQRDHAKYLLSRTKPGAAAKKQQQQTVDEFFTAAATSPARGAHFAAEQENSNSSSNAAATGKRESKAVSPSTANKKAGGLQKANTNTGASAAVSPSPKHRSLSPDCCAGSPGNSHHPRNGAHGRGGACLTPSMSPIKQQRCSSAPAPPQPVACGCLHVAGWRLMTPRFRVMALLKKHGEVGNLDAIVDALRQTYTSDAEMIEDMDARYGPEPTDIDAELLARSVEERIATHAERWTAIRANVDMEMQASAHAFQNVIRTLSVMRIFIEGSQSTSYGIDFSDRQRREAAQQAVLSRLRSQRALFVSPPRVLKEKLQQQQQKPVEL